MSSKTSIAGFVVLCLSFLSPSTSNANETNFNFISSREINENVSAGLHEMMEVRTNSNVKKYIKSYLIRGKAGTTRIIGNAAIYFPIYEKYLQELGLPDELKYISVIESALNPHAQSAVGAVGLWQFMPATAREQGLIIDDYVDERKDIHKSTEAALKYLKFLHNKYNDWTLAIASYNCGYGRVNRCIKKANSKKFEDIYKYLPKETQHYVDRFVAVNYAMKNYQFYNLRPKYSDYNLQFIQVNKIYTRYSFTKIAQLTGIDKAIIERLNPSYRKGIIPPNSNGYYLLLPALGVSESWNESVAQLN